MRCLGTLEFLCDFYDRCQATQKDLIVAGKNTVTAEFCKENDADSDKENTAPPTAESKRKTRSVANNCKVEIKNENNCDNDSNESYCNTALKQNNVEDNAKPVDITNKEIRLGKIENLKQPIRSTRSTKLSVTATLNNLQNLTDKLTGNVKSAHHKGSTRHIKVERKPTGRKVGRPRKKTSLSAKKTDPNIQLTEVNKLVDIANQVNVSSVLQNNEQNISLVSTKEQSCDVQTVVAKGTTKEVQNNFSVNNPKTIEDKENHLPKNKNEECVRSKAVSVIVKQEKTDTEETEPCLPKVNQFVWIPNEMVAYEAKKASSQQTSTIQNTSPPPGDEAENILPNNASSNLAHNDGPMYVDTSNCTVQYTSKQTFGNSTDICAVNSTEASANGDKINQDSMGSLNTSASVSYIASEQGKSNGEILTYMNLSNCNTSGNSNSEDSLCSENDYLSQNMKTKKQIRSTVITMSQKNLEAVMSDGAQAIEEEKQNEDSNLSSSTVEGLATTKSERKSVSTRRSKEGTFGKISELISQEQKEAIETHYTIDMSIMNSDEVTKNYTVINKKNIKCNICGLSYPRLDKCQVHVRGHLNMKPYRCKACDFATVTVSNVRCHIRKSHLKIKPFACHLCEKRYVTAVLLEEHYNTHTGERPFKCKLCGFASASRQVLSYHTTIHKPEKDINCKVCGKQFYSRGRMRAHMLIHNKDKVVMCKICCTYLSSAEALELHNKNIHTRDYTCSVCGKKLKSRKALHNHQNVHSAAKYKCTLCPNVYKSSHILKEHLLKHKGIRKYKCNVCEKSFAQQSHLAAHMAVHSDIRFYCPGCNRAFNRHDNMKIHTKRCQQFLANPELKNLLVRRHKSKSVNETKGIETSEKLNASSNNIIGMNVEYIQTNTSMKATIDKKSDIRPEPSIDSRNEYDRIFLCDKDTHDNNSARKAREVIIVENVLGPNNY